MQPEQEKKKGVLTYQLLNAITAKFSFEIPKVKLELFEINYTVHPIISSNIDLESVFVRIVVSGIILGTGQNVINLETVFAFKVKDLKDHVSLQDGKNVFEEKYQPALVVFISLAVSTTRGIFLEKLSGTMYADKLLPIINPSTFFVKDEILKSNMQGTIRQKKQK